MIRREQTLPSKHRVIRNLQEAEHVVPYHRHQLLNARPHQVEHVASIKLLLSSAAMHCITQHFQQVQ